MRVVVAPDSFKECAAAAEVAGAIAAGVRRAEPTADIVLAPMADGGEGTVDALVQATKGTTVSVEVTGPMGEPVAACYGILGGGHTAVIEMAAASGLPLVPPERREVCRATTRGTGELMKHALDQGMKRIILGIGGSATNDGGAGMAQALGFSLRDAAGTELSPGGAALADLAQIDASGVHGVLAACEVLVACDVDNPLCGPHGASRIYGPQKGASEAQALQLDTALRHFGEMVEEELGASVLDLPGAGAAGGLGAGLVAFAGGVLRPGVEIVAEACDLAGRMKGADLVITGEGRMDHQSARGKTPVGVARVAGAQGIPCIALAGGLGEGYRDVYAEGITAVHSICPGPIPLDEAMERARELLADTAEAVVRTWRAASTTDATG